MAKREAWNKGIPTPPEVCVKLSEAHKGHKPSDATRLKMSLARKGKPHSEEWKRRISEANKGKIFSDETRRRISEVQKGKKRHPLSEETKAKIGKIASERMKIWAKEHPQDAIKRLLGTKPMSKLEMRFDEIIKRNNLPYRFVGNGDFLIERKCPDFINTNGEKIAIEIYYQKHKEKFKAEGFEQWKQERINIFARYGWSIMFIDAQQLNDETKIIEKLR